MSKYGVISGPNTGKYGPEITPYLGTFYAIRIHLNSFSFQAKFSVSIIPDGERKIILWVLFGDRGNK